MAANYTDQSSYYLRNKERIMPEIRELIGYIQISAAQLYGELPAQDITREAAKKSEVLLEDLPYIGGDENFLTRNFYLGAAMLAFYLVMKQHEKPVEEAGRIICEAIVAQSSTSIPPAKLNEEDIKKITSERKKAAEGSRKRGLAYDWLTTFIEGDGKTFDWGVDYHTCGICRLFNDHDANEMVPYVCFFDLPLYESRGIGLVRTKTLARGDSKCDFRFNIRGEYHIEWIPDFYSGEHDLPDSKSG